MSGSQWRRSTSDRRSLRTAEWLGRARPATHSMHVSKKLPSDCIPHPCNPLAQTCGCNLGSLPAKGFSRDLPKCLSHAGVEPSCAYNHTDTHNIHTRTYTHAYMYIHICLQLSICKAKKHICTLGWTSLRRCRKTAYCRRHVIMIEKRLPCLISRRGIPGEELAAILD